MADTYARETDNIVWKLAGLAIKGDNPNNFFQKSTWHMRYSPCIWPGGVALGSTGRQIRVQNRIMDNGHEAPAYWQSEHMWFHISRDMICRALTELPDLERVVMYEGFDDPWEIVYEKDGSASPSNPKPYIMATEMPPKTSIPEELLDDIKPRGIKPESDVN